MIKFFVGATIAFFLFVVFEYATLPNVSKIETCFKTNMNQVEFCPTNKSNYVSYKSISPHIINALIISEDGSFYKHKGVDFVELKRSIETNIERKKFARGGSTLTQQLAKNLFLTKDKTIRRKLKELVLALQIEKKYSKQKILEAYLNVVEFGENIYGIKKASQYYFEKHPSEITPLEASFLIFLLPNPKKYSVSYKKKELTRFARSRIQDILYKMSAYKKIDTYDYQYYKSQLSTMWSVAPDIENEMEDYGADYESNSNQEIIFEELETRQQESFDKLNEIDIPAPQEEPQVQESFDLQEDSPEVIE